MTTDKLLEQISSDDLERLVASGIAESRTLEYKECLPGNSDHDKREFLADVSAFANASGGDLVYGAREQRDEQGTPTATLEAMVGVDVSNADQAIQRLENILRDGIAPRIPGVQFRRVDGFERGPAIVVRVPQSWAGPHMIVFQQSGKFFTRHAGGKHQLDVNELRDAFLGSRSASERAETFRTTRLGRILGGAAPAALSSDKILCIHAIPHAALYGALAVDLHKAAADASDFRPIEASGWGPRFNIDGVISVASFAPGQGTTGYVQLFRNGIVEVVFSDIYFNPDPTFLQIAPGVGAGDVRRGVMGILEQVQRLFIHIDVNPPVSLFISLHGVKDVRFHTYSRFASGVFDRHTILLPDVVQSTYTEPLPTVLKPALDALWQAAGIERCLDYSPTGEWEPRQ